MNINEENENIITLGGAQFDKTKALDYGTTVDKTGLRQFFINFKEGTKIRYPLQLRNARIDSKKLGNFYNHDFINFDTLFIEGSEEKDYYELQSCDNAYISTYKDNNADIINIDIGCSNVIVNIDDKDLVNNKIETTNLKQRRS